MADYEESVRRAGGEPRVLAAEHDEPAAALSSLDGLLLTGGGDVNPEIYGEARHPSTDDAEPGRDSFELTLARGALDADLPLLAICRGVQVLNVAAGGTLMQDIPSAVPGALPHAVKEPSFAIAHEVWIDRDSKLGGIMVEQSIDSNEKTRDAAESLAEAAKISEARAREIIARSIVQDRPDRDLTCAVNSRHHQAIGRLAQGLEVSAEAPDGVIEAVERPASKFCIGVQWHPENFWRTGEFRPLFEAFVNACKK